MSVFNKLKEMWSKNAVAPAPTSKVPSRHEVFRNCLRGWEIYGLQPGTKITIIEHHKRYYGHTDEIKAIPAIVLEYSPGFGLYYKVEGEPDPMVVDTCVMETHCYNFPRGRGVREDYCWGVMWR